MGGKHRTEVTEGGLGIFVARRFASGEGEHRGSRVKHSILKEAPPYENAGSSEILYFSEGPSGPKIFASHNRAIPLRDLCAMLSHSCGSRT